MKKKFICTVCGYIYEGTEAPEKCPICKAPASKFKEMEDAVDDDMTFATVHVLGQAYKDGVNEDVIKGLKDHFNGECGEVGMYLAMARRQFVKLSKLQRLQTLCLSREPDHAFVLQTFSVRFWVIPRAISRLVLQQRRVLVRISSSIAKLAKEQGSDAIHDTVHEMAKDEARHCAGFAGLYKRYFK